MGKPDSHSFTLHPSPFTLHPSPFTLHPSPFTLHLSPFLLVRAGQVALPSRQKRMMECVRELRKLGPIAGMGDPVAWQRSIREDRGPCRLHVAIQDVETLLERLRSQSPHGSVLVGFDFPIGLPIAYAERRDLSSFRDALQKFGEKFYQVTDSPSLDQPFYPPPSGYGR